MVAKKHIGSAVVVTLGTVGAMFQFFPDAVLGAWHMMPDDLKASLPPIAVKWISYALFFLSVVGRLWPRKVQTDGKSDSGSGGAGHD